jgi:hypothetical protein
MLDILEYIEAFARSGARPMIHFDTHGDQEEGLIVAGSEECIPWEELGDCLRKVNIATGNNLCVISAACFGFRLAKWNTVLKPAMFYLLIGAPEKIYFDFTERKLFGFYKDVFDNSEIVEAHERHLSIQTKLFHCEQVFVRGIAEYFSEHCMGSSARRRIEQLITEAVKQGVPSDPANLRKARRLAKDTVRPSEAIFLKYANVYLIGRKPGVTFAEIIEFIRHNKARMRGLSALPICDP